MRIKLSVLAILLVLLILFDTSSLLTLSSSIHSWIIEDISFRSTVGDVVYPGSRNAKIAIMARYVGSGEAINPLACLQAPEGFGITSSNCSIARDQDGNVLYSVKPGYVVNFVFSLNVDRSVTPGYYKVVVNISHYDVQSNTYVWEEKSIQIYVSEYPQMDLLVKDIYLTPYAYPGACPVSVVLGVSNRGKSSIYLMRITLELPSELAKPSILNYTYPYEIQPGQEVYMVLGETCINSLTPPNSKYKALIRVEGTLSTSDRVLYVQSKVYEADLYIGDKPSVDIRLLTYELTSGVALPGLRNTGLRILIESHEDTSLYIGYSTIRLQNAATVNDSSTGLYTHDLQLTYMESTWITYSGININDTATYVNISISLVGIKIQEGTRIPFSVDFNLLIPLAQREIELDVLKTTWRRDIAYPGSSNNVLVISLINKEPLLSITDGIVEIYSPEGIIYPSRRSVVNVVITPGGITEVELTGLSISSDVKPGIYRIIVEIDAVIRCLDNSFKPVRLLREAYLPIAGLEEIGKVLPIFELVDVHWGEISPQIVYPGNPRGPLTITIQNKGISPASNVLLIIDSIEPNEIGSITTSSSCSPQLNPGSQCNAVFYLDLSKAKSGMVDIKLTVRYNLPALGIDDVLVQHVRASLYLPDYPPGGYVELVRYGWLNDYPVFPRSKGAVLTITLANLEPYSIGAIRATLNLPSCMEIRRSQTNVYYVPGPVATLQSFTMSFTVNAECRYGSYIAMLELDYYLQAYGSGVRKKKVYHLDLVVENDENSVEYIASGWLNTPLTPPVHGAQLYIVFRNRKFPSITSPVLRLKLPDGVVESKTNSSEPLLLPVSRLSPQQFASIQVQDIQELLSQLLMQTTQQTITAGSFSRGDILVYLVSLNIDRPKRLDLQYELRFIDHWGEEYSVSSNLTAVLTTNPPLLRVQPESPLVVFNNGTAILDVLIVNEYDSGIGNLYVALIPISGNVIPQGSLRYIERLDGRSNRTVRFELIINPVQATIGTIPVSMSSAVFTAALIYTDQNGLLHSQNTSIAVMVKPFIEIRLLPGVVSRYTKGTLTVSGVLANVGISTARSVIIYVKYGEKEALSIVGDLDASSQMPFRIELQTPYIGDQCNVTIKYLDQYGVEYVIQESVNVVKVEEVETTRPIEQPVDTTMRVIIVVMIALFLGGLFLVLYRHSKQVMRRITHASP